MTELTIEKALSKAKIGMMMLKDTVFFSTLCLSLDLSLDESVGTAGTDGRRLIINPSFFLGLTEGERIFLLAHETLHVAYLHCLRRGTRDPRLYNAAADYVINAELKKRGFHFIQGGLYDPKYADMSTEEVYTKLEQNPNQQPQCMPDLLEGDGSISTQGDIDTIEQEVLAKISRAAMMAEMSNQAGSVPVGIKRHLEDISKPKINWRVVLRRFFSDLSPSDYSWRRPNRKYMPNYLPKLVSQNLGRIDFAIDTSGSISNEDFNQFISEVHGVMRMLNPKEVGVYQFDHELQGSHVVRSVRDIIKLPFLGGGGTRPQAAIDEFSKNKAKALIMLTDGYFSKRPLKDPKRPVIWVIYDNPNFTAPFGKIVHINL